MISAEVCQPGATASLELSEPLSDSLYAQPDVVVAGTVSLVTQVELYIDGVYTRTVAVSQSSNQFQATLTLAPGTHTIRASGIPLCGGSLADELVALTYQPPPRLDPDPSDPNQPEPANEDTVQTPTPPSYGGDLPTVINPEIPRGPGDQVVNDYEPPEQTSGDGTGSSYFGRLRDSVDWSRWSLLMCLRGIGVIFGIVLLVGGRYLLGFVSSVRNAEEGSRRRIDTLIRSTGLVLIIVSLAFV
jgi:hypothetical protein